MSPQAPTNGRGTTVAGVQGTEVHDDAERSAYEITVDGVHAGHAFRELRDGRTVLTHTEIDDAFGGRGIGGELARGALDDVRAHGRFVVPECDFVAGWIARHPEYLDVVDPADRDRVRALAG